MNTSLRDKKRTYWIPVLAMLLIGGGIALAFISTEEEPPILGDIHIHADFKVYLDGKMYNFSQEKYMSNETHAISRFLHLHDNDGEIMHQHIKGVTLGDFFNTINMTFNNTCFVLDNGTKYCNTETKTLKFYVNGNNNMQFGTYEFKDLDRMLITYGNDSQAMIAQQLASVTDRACIQSGLCPERGMPGNESSCTTLGGCIE